MYILKNADSLNINGYNHQNMKVIKHPLQIHSDVFIVRTSMGEYKDNTIQYITYIL